MAMKLSTRRFVIGLAVFSGLFFALLLCFFFYNLSTTTSEYSIGGVVAPHQLFYNFINGRPFQDSLFATHGGDAGFSYNPYPFIHIYAIHVYLTPYIFAILWSVWPNIYWLYGLVIVVAYASMAVFTWKTLSYLSPKTFKSKTIVGIALLMASGFLITFQTNAQLMLFGAPFMLAAYYFLLRHRKGWFLFSVILLCLTSEDLAMVAVTFALYIFLFERKEKTYAFMAWGFAVPYLTVLFLFIQPAARSELVLTTASTTASVVAKVSSFFPPDIPELLIGFGPVIAFLPAFAIVCLLFGRPDVAWVRVAGLVLLAPFPHWGESAVVGAGHHLMPVIVFLYIALIIVIGKTPDIDVSKLSFSIVNNLLLLGCCAIFILGNCRVMASNLPDPLRLYICKLVGKTTVANRIEISLLERRANQKVIETIGEIPKNSSLVYLTNSSVEGFIAGRSNIWKFPDYYDAADFLIMQPNARQSSFSFSVSGVKTVVDAIATGKTTIDNDAAIEMDSVKAIVHHLVVEQKSHHVVIESPLVVLLERIQKIPMQSPPSTIGFGWLHNL